MNKTASLSRVCSSLFCTDPDTERFHVFAIQIFAVVPGKPTISPIAKPLADGHNISLICTANLGRPAGEIIWSRQRKGDNNYQILSTNQATTTLMHHENGTSSAVSSLRLQLLAEDDGAKYRCETTSRIMHSWERRLSDEITLNLNCELRECA